MNTPEDFNREMTQRINAMEKTERTIVEYARGLVPVLKDAGRANSAEELQALVFLLDAQRQELEKHVATNSPAFIEWVTTRAKAR